MKQAWSIFKSLSILVPFFAENYIFSASANIILIDLRQTVRFDQPSLIVLLAHAE
jgi:hypothetical protein